MTSATRMARRLRWSQAVGGNSRPQPVVVLLGPVGSGKSSTLNSMQVDCGSAVVHAKVDFEPSENRPTSTVETLAQIAGQMSGRKWPARGVPRFARFTLGLIAAQTRLNPGDRVRSRENLQSLIGDFARNPDMEREGLAAGPLAAELPGLVRALGRRPLKGVKPGDVDIPGAEDYTLLDALVSLNQQVHADPRSMTSWLTAAFLADVREDHVRMAKPDPGSRCHCDVRDRRHLHNWVLLLDNIDHGVGEEFLEDLQDAREHQLRVNPKSHDALLVIASSGRWNHDWGEDWRPVWIPEPGDRQRARTVVSCDRASYEHWLGEQDADAAPPPRYYPVLMEPLAVRETARILETTEMDVRCRFVQQATGGLPAAVNLLAPVVRGQKLEPGARDTISRLDGPGRKGESAWLERLEKLRLTRHVQDIDIREFVTAAPYATAPWLMPADAAEEHLPRQVGRIITELRTALWVTVQGDDRGGPGRTKLHPWVARMLTSALAARPGSDANGYLPRFRAFLASMPSTNAEDKPLSDVTREMYCHLALDHFDDVVDHFKEKFDVEPHQSWIDRLSLVASAPGYHSLTKDSEDVFRELTGGRRERQRDGRQDPSAQAVVVDERAIENIVVRLVAAERLASDPFAVPDPRLKDRIVNIYRRELPPLGTSDVSAFYSAARRADDTRL